MLKLNETSPSASASGGVVWDKPEPHRDFIAKHPAEDVRTWRELRDGIIDLAREHNWSKSEIQRRIGMAESTFSQWLSGKLLGVLSNQNTVISRWLAAVEESASMASAVPTSPGYISTWAADEIYATLMLAQLTSGFVTITLDAGRGKTTACRYFQSVRPHVNMVTLNPKVKTVHGALNLLALQLGVRVFNQAELVETIGNRLSRAGDGALLIIDEAQHADPETVNQFRYFSDNFSCGLALVGNSAIRKRLSQSGHNTASRDQITSRIDKNLAKDDGLDDDLRMFIAAWGITDPACVKFLFALGKKGGSLRQIDRTIKIACILTRGGIDALEERHLRAAWRRRDLEGME